MIDYNKIFKLFDNFRHSYGIHYEIYYSKAMDWVICIWRKGTASDGGNETIFNDQSCDMDLLFSAAYDALLKYAKEIEK